MSPLKTRDKPQGNCSASTDKIYIRKDIRSPLTATPTFVTGSALAGGNMKSPLSTRQGLFDQGILLNVHMTSSSASTSDLTKDLSTKVIVVMPMTIPKRRKRTLLIYNRYILRLRPYESYQMVTRMYKEGTIFEGF
ncbi:orphan steroid hormone receptor 2-like [Lytechinus pictus]|uniref:orphan steroid hormone receptor 2-like n=1 Tax=Lytechinus pictus TaxID=7653 RepID=UPI0030B9B96A